MKKNPDDLPYSVCGVAWRELQKGERISAEKVEEMYFLLTDKKLITASRDQNRDLSFRSLQVKQWIESNRVEIGKPLVLRQDKGSLVIFDRCSGCRLFKRSGISRLDQTQEKYKKNV